jgi:uncharacterized protein involved in exopolysaccharide biosynthesis
MDLESLLALEPDIDDPGKPLHTYFKGLVDKIGLLWMYRRFLITFTSLCVVIALGISFLLPTRYVATAYLMPPDMNPVSGLDMMIDMKSGGALMGAMGGELNDVLGMRSPGQLYIREMQTRPVEDGLIKRFNLSDAYRAKSLEATRKSLEANTAFDEDRKSGIISVQVTDTSPARAAEIANAYADELGRLQADLNSSAGRREREYFGTQLIAARAQLEQSSRALSDFSGKNGAINLPLQDAAVVSSMSEVQGQLIAAEAELKGILPIYTENHLRVRELRAQISELEKQLEQIRGQAPHSGPAASSQPGENSGASGSPSRMNQLAGLTTQYMGFYGKAKTDEAMVETLTQQYEIAKLQESRHVAEIQLVDPALAPERKTYPKRKMICLIGLVLGFFCAVTYVVAKDWWRNAGDENEWKKLLQPVLNNAPRKSASSSSAHNDNHRANDLEMDPQPTRSKY